MKRILTLLLCCCLLSLTACGGSPSAGAETPVEPEPAQEQETPAEEAPEVPAQEEPQETTEPEEIPAEPEETPEAPAQEDRAPMLAAYKAALETLLNEHRFPGDTESRTFFGDTPSGDQFAVFDVDGDGREELMLTYTDTTMAEMETGIFGYDAEQDCLVQKLAAFPVLTFYDNGIIQESWSHNQGLAGDFWPYTLYQYDKDADCYNPVGMVDAWDKAMFPEDFEGNPFPEEVDVSHSGYVYYIMEYTDYNTDHPVDQAEYQAWRDSWLQGAGELTIPYQDLTEENIANLT
ncbi:MAG: hypothetical protein ACI3U8_04005 [Candidatus Onthomonas sp.]